MITVYRVSASPDAPRLRLLDPEATPGRFFTFDGEKKAPYSARQAFDVIAEPLIEGRQFYSFARGVLAGPVHELCTCEEMLYATGGTERLSLKAGTVPFTAINPIDFLPKPRDGTAPCLVDRFYAPIFRIEGQDPRDIFCVSGFDVPLDEFKVVYDRYGFRGLVFDEIWAGTHTP